MDFVIKESFIQGKSSIDACEDGRIVTADYVAVVDGATSKSNFEIEGSTPGRKAMEIILEEISKLSPGLSVFDAITFINEGIIRYYKMHHILDEVSRFPEMRLTASAAVYCHSRNEVWLIGDCQCRIGEICFQNNKKVDRVLSEMRALVLYSALQKGFSIKSLRKNDIGRHFIYPMLKQQYVWQNNLNSHSEYCYTVLDGFPVDPSQVHIIPVDSHSVVLATDGYFDLFGTLRETECVLLNQIENDPLCIGMGYNNVNMSTKGVIPGNYSFDDRTYVRICRL